MSSALGLLVVVLFGLIFWQAEGGPLAPLNLRVNHLLAPIVDTPIPRFTWTPLHSNRSAFQSAYEIQVIQEPNGIVFWSSGKVLSDSLSALYPAALAKPLESDSLYTWTISWFDQDGIQSDTSNDTFGTAFLNPNEWEGEWIGGNWYGGEGYENLYQDNLLRKQFTISQTQKVTWARAYISGLGYYELYINAKRVGDYLLDPGWPTYYKRVYYSAYDVADYLQPGENVIVVLLGHGWYSSNEIREPNGLMSLMFQLNLNFDDETYARVVSDLTWYGAPSPISFDSIYDGETYDSTQENPSYYLPNVTYSKPWALVQPVTPPGGVLTVMPMEHVRFQHYIYPVSFTRLENSSTYVFDMGQQFSGWSKLSITGKRGTVVTLSHAEVLYPNGSLNTANLRTAKATENYILSGTSSPEIYEPRFTYHGFRYVSLTAVPVDGIQAPTQATITGVHVRSDVVPAGNIQATTPTPTLDAVQNIILWSQRSNLMHVPTDCVSRDERKGWMGDASVASEAFLYNFYVAAFYKNFLALIAEDQYPTGVLGPTAPWTWGDMGVDPNWMGALTFMTYMTSLYYNDKDLMARFYENNKLYLGYLIDTLGAEGMSNFFADGYGDWVPPPPALRANISYTSAFSYMLTLKEMLYISQVLGQDKDYKMYSQLAPKMAVMYNAAFFDANNNTYMTGGQTEMAMALYLGVVEAENYQAVVNNLLNSIVSTYSGHLSTGILGTKYLMDVLHNIGRDDVALQLAENVDYPSWGFMVYNNLEASATAMWERWDTPMEGGEMDTRNQQMFTSVGSWLYKALVGITIPEDQNFGASNVSTYYIDPSVEGSLIGVTGSTQSARGEVSVSWKRAGGPLCGMVAQGESLTLSCFDIGSSGKIQDIVFASYGTPFGGCMSYGINNSCHAGFSCIFNYFY